MKKERVFYLDFIRAISTLLIVLTHFNALFVYNVYKPELAVWTIFVSNIYIGELGVALFFIISGASLMYVYGGDKPIQLGNFYKKRFISIYPMFWIAYIFCFCYSFIQWRALPEFNTASLLLSLFGVDGMLLNMGVPCLYFVGEWFLGVIIIFYVMSPLLIWGVKKHPIITSIITVALYAVNLILFGTKTWLSVSFLSHIPVFVFGMLFVKYVKKVHWSCALASLAVVIINHFLKPTFIPNRIQVLYVGIAAFLFLVFIADYLKAKPIKTVTATICKYSYACFLSHHWITLKIAEKFDLNLLTKKTSFILLAVCSMIIIVASFVLYKANDFFIDYFKRVFKREKADVSLEEAQVEPENATAVDTAKAD